MCDPQALACLLNDLSTTEKIASSIRNFIDNLEIPEIYSKNQYVLFKILIHRIHFEFGFEPICDPDNPDQIAATIYRDNQDPSLADVIKYTSSTYGLLVTATFTREQSKFSVTLNTAQAPRRSIVIDLSKEQMLHVNGKLKRSRAEFDGLVLNLSAKLLNFFCGYTSASGSTSRDPIRQEAIDIPETPATQLLYHMKLA